ncbi:MAG: DUF2752 domain-containing protein [Deltaproteobacteria bacterium]|nr:DUF2752 domain-containing protein [Deltaproteobacteria bacterium]
MYSIKPSIILSRLFLLISSSGILLLSFWLKPDTRGFGTHEQLGLPPCPFLFFTGYPCPACGLTTSFSHMAHGHFMAAFSSHPLGPFLFLMNVALIFISLKNLLSKKNFWDLLPDKQLNAFLILFVFSFLSSWGYRILQIWRTL